MSARLRRAISDPSRFEGNGISYKAKLIGIEDVREARGDLMCQEALIKLKNSVKISGEHKRKIFVNVTLEGLKIIDAISLIVLHIHPVHRISFISRDTTDTRAFGYVFGTEDGLHKFFAIKTAAAAEQLVLTLRDLFQVVYEMKKKEMEAAKEKLEKEALTANAVKENLQPSGMGSTSGIGQAPIQKVNADTENIYQVPTNNAPVIPETRAEQVANLLDLEDQAEHILKGIEQIKNLDFDSVTNDTFSTSPQTSPLAKLTPAPSAGTNQDWGFYTNSFTNSSVAAPQGLGNFQAGPFPAMSQQSFASTNFQTQGGFGGPGGFNMVSGGLPLTKDPFANDPFGSPAQQPRIPATSGFGAGSGYNQLYGMQSMPPRLGFMGVHGMMPGMVPHGMISPPAMGGMRSPFGLQQSPAYQRANPFGDDSNILQPMKKDSGLDSNVANTEPVKTNTKTREDLFGDLLVIKKSSPSNARSPKDMFAQINAHDRKPMNEMMGQPGQPYKSSPLTASQNKAQASDASSDPFGDADSVILDKTRGLLLSDSGDEDPFDTSHIPPVLAESLSHPINFVKPACATPPPVPHRQPSSYSSHTDTAARSPMPTSAPPPPPVLCSLPTPPLPCRTVIKSGIQTDVNDNVSLSTSDICVNIADTSIMLPPPVEPPPQLPSHLAIQPSSLAPPSPTSPRPNLKLARQSPHVHHKGHTIDSQEHEVISRKPNLSDSSSPTQCMIPADKEISLNSQNSELIQAYNVAQNCVITSGVDPPTLKINDLENCSPLKENSNSHSQDKLHHQVFGSKSSKLDWVGFDNCENLPENDSNDFIPVLSAADEDDPFNMPLHLTPGFKAVAKFGSDPFDDSFSGPFGDDVWHPFDQADQGVDQENCGSSMNSPFGDAFVPSSQQGWQ